MKKTFSKFLATAAAVSMLASASAVVNADEAISFNTTTCEHGVIIESVVNGDALETIVVPAEIDGAAVVGVADFAFADLDALVTIDTMSATNLTAEHVSTVSFTTKASLTDYFVALFGEDATEEEVLTYGANEVYGDKEAWTAEELADVKTKIAAKAELAGTTIPEDLSDVNALTEAAAVMLQNEEAMNLTQTTSDNLAVWETTVPNDMASIIYDPESPIASIIDAIPSIAILLGDANLDGKVNVRDAAFIASKLAKAEGDDLTAEADFNEDGKLNVRDAAAIATALAKGEIAQ